MSDTIINSSKITLSQKANTFILISDLTGRKLLDYQKIFMNNDDMFANEDHLNTKGGKTLDAIIRKGNVEEE